MVCAWVAAAAPAYHIETAPARRIEGVLTMRIDTPEMAASEWILFAANPPELLGQTDLSATLSPSGRPSKELSPQRRGILWARVPTRGKQFTAGVTAEVRYRATLRSRRLVAGRPPAGTEAIPPLPPQERRFALEATPLIDFESEAVTQWLDKHRLRRREDEGTIAFARRVYAVIVRSFLYELRPEMDRRASAVCTADRADCAGLSSLFKRPSLRMALLGKWIGLYPRSRKGVWPPSRPRTPPSPPPPSPFACTSRTMPCTHKAEAVSRRMSMRRSSSRLLRR